MLTLKTIDAHAEGGPLRLVVDGFPSPRGLTMIDKGEWARKHADHLRRCLMLEPRGHADMRGAVLTEPVSPGSHAGVLFMDNEGYAHTSGGGIIAVATIALERGLVMPGGDDGTVVFDTTAGTIRARARFAERNPASAGASAPRVDRVSVVMVPAFVLHGGLAVRLGARQIRADVAFGGAFHAIVDAEAAGVPLDAAHAPELRRAGMAIRRAVEADVVHPLDSRVRGIHGTVFTGPPHAGHADLRAVTVCADAAIERSPSGTGMSAIMSVLDAIGIIDAERPFVCEGLVGTRLTGWITARTAVGGHGAVVSEIEGSAWIVGEGTLYADESDPLKDGFRM